MTTIYKCRDCGQKLYSAMGDTATRRLECDGCGAMAFVKVCERCDQPHDERQSCRRDGEAE